MKKTMDTIESNGQTVGQNEICRQLDEDRRIDESPYPGIFPNNIKGHFDYDLIPEDVRFSYNNEECCLNCQKNLNHKDVESKVCIDCYQECDNCAEQLTEEERDHNYCKSCLRSFESEEYNKEDDIKYDRD